MVLVVERSNETINFYLMGPEPSNQDMLQHGWGQADAPNQFDVSHASKSHPPPLARRVTKNLQTPA
jgi:hypothetical protein